MEEIKNNPLEEKKLKDEYKSASGKKVATDFFIYSCMGDHNTFKEIGPEYSIKKRWKRTSEAEEEKLKDTFSQILTWYNSKHPELFENAILDYDRCSKILESMVLMLADLQDLLKSKKILFTADSEACSFLSELLEEKCPQTSEYVLAYLKWVNSTPEETKYEIADLPPVGRYYHMLKDASYKKSRYQSKPSDEASTATKASPKGSKAPSPQDEKENEIKQERERLALIEVDKAIHTLNNHPSMNEFKLRPQNSYIRRQQHKKVAEAGLTSTSVGQAEDRSVLITKE